MLKAGADWVHFDVMDNHYVPNLTIGPLVCEALRKHGVTAPIDVHLMVKPVDRIVPDFADGRRQPDQLPSRGQRARAPHHPADQVGGCQAGLVLNPGTPLDGAGLRAADELDLVLLMSVNPGFGGQAFIPSALDKLKRVRDRIDEAGQGHPAGSRRRGEGRQHPRHRRRGRRHLRGRLGHLQRARLRRRDRADAGAHRTEGLGDGGWGLVGRECAARYRTRTKIDLPPRRECLGVRGSHPALRPTSPTSVGEIKTKINLRRRRRRPHRRPAPWLPCWRAVPDRPGHRLRSTWPPPCPSGADAPRRRPSSCRAP